MKKRFPLLIRWLLAITFLTRIALAFRPEVKLTERPYQDDAYYTLTCGYQFAAGHGFSVDGIHPTNGVQPLIIPIYALFFQISGFDKWLAVRLTFLLVALLECYCVYALYRVILLLKHEQTSDSNILYRAEFIAPIMWTFLFDQILINGSGLETGIYASLIISSLWFYSHLRQAEIGGISLPVKQWIFFGVVLGLMVLARIDGAIIVVCFAITDCFSRKNAFLKKIFPAVIFCTVALIVSSPWWYYNYITFGSIMPISGQSEAMGAHLVSNIPFAISALTNILLTLIYIPYPIGAILNTFLLVCMIGTIAFLNRRYHLLQELRQRYFLLPILPLILGAMIQFFYYVAFFGAPYFLGRYLHPLRIGWIILFALALPIFIRKRNTFTEQFSRNRKFFLLIGSIYVTGAMIFNIGSYVLNFTTSKSSQAYHLGVWALAHPQEKIGLASSGTAGFMADNIVNLDGKVNFDALQARKEHRMGEYIVKSGITILTDWDYISNAAQIKASGADFIPIDTVSGAGIYKRIK